MRREVFKKVLEMCALSQKDLCLATESFFDAGIGLKVYPPQLNRWLNGKCDLHGAAIESLERALPETSRALYYGFLASEMTAQALKDAAVLRQLLLDQ